MVKKTKGSANVSFDVTLNEEQKAAKDLILSTPYSFVIGNAGSGKTMLSTFIALSELFKRNFDRIVITRPTVGTEDNGFLPGTLEEKMEPWLIPIRSNLRKVYNHKEKLEALENDGKLEIMSLQHFRGNTFDNAVVIVDEFSNMTKSQLRMAVGRLGKNSIMIFTGDYQQIDLKNKSDSAIHDLELLKDCKHVSIITLEENHRHPALSAVLNLLK